MFIIAFIFNLALKSNYLHHRGGIKQFSRQQFDVIAIISACLLVDTRNFHRMLYHNQKLPFACISIKKNVTRNSEIY